MKKLLVLLFLLPSLASATITHVQTLAGGAACVATTCAVAFASNSTAGNFIAVCWRYGSGGQVVTLSDTLLDSYTSDAKEAIDTGDLNSTNGIGYTSNVLSTGANTVTISVPVSANMRITASEFSGVATSNALDKTTSAIGASISPASGAVTPTADGELLYACTHSSDNETYTVGTDFTFTTTVITTANLQRLAAEYYVQPTAASHDGTFTKTQGVSWGAVMTTFKIASAAASTPTPVPRVLINGQVNLVGNGNIQ